MLAIAVSVARMGTHPNSVADWPPAGVDAIPSCRPAPMSTPEAGIRLPSACTTTPFSPALGSNESTEPGTTGAGPKTHSLRLELASMN